MPPINPRRRTLAGAGVVNKSKPPIKPSSSSSSNGSVTSSNSTARRRIPKSRQSMIPRCAGGGSSIDNDTNNCENNGRRTSGIAAPSPSRKTTSRSSIHRPPASSRKSLGGAILQSGHHQYHSTPSKSSSTPSKNRRVSLAPSSNKESSSSNIDPRDIKDKLYLQNAIRKMVSYLKTRGYQNASTLNVKQLVTSGPSGRDFQNIMTFLFRRVDPTFHQQPIMSGKQNQRTDEIVLKFEDEVSMAFRCLGYPFPISKTGLVAVGSPHTWPALIAAIDWLVDVLVIRDEEDQLDWWGPSDVNVDNVDDNNATDSNSKNNDGELLTVTGSATRVGTQFHKFLRKSMVAFLNDNNELCEELEGGLLDVFMKDSERVEAYLTGLDAECGKMKEEIGMLNAEVDGLSEARNKQEEFATNIEKFLNLIQTLNDHKAELTDKVETLTIEKSTTESEMQDCSTKIEQLRQTINSQELSQEDVRRMEREKIRVEEQIGKQSSILEGQVAVLTEAQEKWNAIYKLLEQKVEEYNGKASQLELVPSKAKHAKGHKFEVKLDKKKAGDSVTNLMRGVDIMGVMKPHVKKLINGYESETTNEKKQLAEIKDQAEATENSTEQLVEDIETINDQITSCSEECEASRERLEGEIKDKCRQMDLLNTKISSLNDPEGIESTIAKYDSEYKQLQLVQQKQEKESMTKKKAVADEIRRALTLAKEYEDTKKKQLSEMHAYIRKKKEEGEQIRLLDS